MAVLAGRRLPAHVDAQGQARPGPRLGGGRRATPRHRGRQRRAGGAVPAGAGRSGPRSSGGIGTSAPPTPSQPRGPASSDPATRPATTRRRRASIPPGAGRIGRPAGTGSARVRSPHTPPGRGHRPSPGRRRRTRRRRSSHRPDRPAARPGTAIGRRRRTMAARPGGSPCASTGAPARGHGERRRAAPASPGWTAGRSVARSAAGPWDRPEPRLRTRRAGRRPRSTRPRASDDRLLPRGRSLADRHPGGHCILRPPSRWRWRWPTVCPPSAPALMTSR